MPEWVKASAILKLLPKDHEAKVVARPELQTYTQRLSWVKAQLAHQRATSQAQAVAAGRADMALGELCGAAGSKEPVLAIFEALEQLLKKGKGKGKSKGGGGAANQQPGGKGGPQGGGARAGNKPNSRADQVCWHCGRPGHKRSERQAYSTYLQAQPKGKGKGKGVGGDRALNEFHPDPGYEDPEGGDLLDDPEELNAAEWYLGGSPDGEAPEPGLGFLAAEAHCWHVVPSWRRARSLGQRSTANHGSGWQPTLANRFSSPFREGHGGCRRVVPQGPDPRRLDRGGAVGSGPGSLQLGQICWRTEVCVCSG